MPRDEWEETARRQGPSPTPRGTSTRRGRGRRQGAGPEMSTSTTVEATSSILGKPQAQGRTHRTGGPAPRLRPARINLEARRKPRQRQALHPPHRARTAAKMNNTPAGRHTPTTEAKPRHPHSTRARPAPPTSERALGRSVVRRGSRRHEAPAGRRHADVELEIRRKYHNAPASKTSLATQWLRARSLASGPRYDTTTLGVLD